MPHTYTAPMLSYAICYFFLALFFLVTVAKGKAVAGVGFVWASVMTVIFLYRQTLPLAGVCVRMCVGLVCVWIGLCV
jgi:hypothetical protein